MRRLALVAAVLGLSAGGALAHGPLDHHRHDHGGPAAHIAVDPDVEGKASVYYGHFYHGTTHHGQAHHGMGHANRNQLHTPVGHLVYATRSRGFVVLVSPNLVGEAEARAEANRVASAHCATVPGATRIVYGKVRRHSPVDLEAWEFRGACR